MQIEERFSPEKEVILDVVSYNNHPQFNITVGPIGGFDIATYNVNDTPLLQEGVVAHGKVYPACLPSKLHKSNRGIFAGTFR